MTNYAEAPWTQATINSAPQDGLFGLIAKGLDLAPANTQEAGYPAIVANQASQDAGRSA